MTTTEPPPDLTTHGWCVHSTHPECEGISPTARVRADGCEMCQSCEDARQREGAVAA